MRKTLTTQPSLGGKLNESYFGCNYSLRATKGATVDSIPKSRMFLPHHLTE